MDVYGMDFTSAPSRRKPIRCQHCRLEGHVLHALSASPLAEFTEFEKALKCRGPWIAGIDFPFGLPRRFVTDVGWPPEWCDYVRHAEKLGKEGFEAALKDYRNRQPKGQKEHRRMTDVLAGSLSPQKLHGTPVGKMFFQGTSRLLDAGVHVPGLQAGDPNRIVVEAYPGVVARTVTPVGYKTSNRRTPKVAPRDARSRILNALTGGELAPSSSYGITVVADDPNLLDDPTGDSLDALLCAVQAAWAWLNQGSVFDNPNTDSREGWIADPKAFWAQVPSFFR